jgi:hypothetical protein
MNNYRSVRHRQILPEFCKRILLVTLLSAALVPAVAMAQEVTLEWYTIDGGGAIRSESADQQWQLSGTIGQWDSSKPQASTGAGWRLTGGFWSILVNPIDKIFHDRFESEWAAPGLDTQDAADG